jgi:predicted amidohydrolase
VKSKLHISALQIPLLWEAPTENRAYIDKHLQKIDYSTDFILLPEMFTSGFTMNPKVVEESMEGPSIQWMQSWASRLNAAIGGSLVIQEGAYFYNRFVVVTPSNEMIYYDKRHTFKLAGEHKAYRSGTNDGIFEYQGWKICLRICYDLRFPVWSSNIKKYDLLLYVANWPKPRIHAWDILLQARAIENLSYVVGVNRIGQDKKDHDYPGHTAIYDALGHCISEKSTSELETLFTAELDHLELQEHRKRFGFLEDLDNFDLY